MKFKERKRKHDDAHRPLGGRGKKSVKKSTSKPVASLVYWDCKKEKEVVGNAMGKALSFEGEVDYKLEGDSCWISVGGLSVHLMKKDDGVDIDVYEIGKEMDDPLDGCYVHCFHSENRKSL